MVSRNNKSYRITTNLEGVRVTHKNEGIGKVILHETKDNDSSYIKVHYDNGKTMEHKYPDVFFHNNNVEFFLTCDDENINNKIFEDIKYLGMTEVQLATERYLRNQKEIEANRILKEVKFADFIIAANDFRCKKNKHTIVDIIAIIQVLEIETGVKNESINGWYCRDCDMFYIDTVDYNKLRHKGILMCKNMTEDKYIKNILNNNSNSYLSQESILHEYGYNVNGQEELTDGQRRGILAMLVDNQILDREWIKSFLRGLISRFKRQNKDFSNAIEKWQSDIDFISRYEINSLSKVGVKSLR